MTKTIVEKKPFIVVGVPAFNEEHTIAQVVLDSKKYADEVVVCDDGSTDYTVTIAKKMGADVIVHAKNNGYGSSIKSLFHRAHELGADVFVTLDADGQHEPNEIPQIIAPILSGSADMVIGSRFVDKKGTEEMPKYRQLGAQLITKMVNGSANNHITDSQSGFRAYNKLAVERLDFHEPGMGASVEILFKAGQNDLRIVEVPSTCKYNLGKQETSTHNPLSHGVGVVVSLMRLIVEERPLLMLGVPSLMFLLAGIVFGVWMIQIYAVTHSIITNIALASIGFLFIGVFTLSTAITLYAIARVSKKFSASKL